MKLTRTNKDNTTIYSVDCALLPNSTYLAWFDQFIALDGLAFL